MTAYALLKLLERARPILDSAAREQGLTGDQSYHAVHYSNMWLRSHYLAL